MLGQSHEIAAAGGFGLQFLDSDGYEEGSVGWGAVNCLATMPHGHDVPMRLTGVFHLEGGHWVAVQVHFSLGAANEDALGLELSTPLEAIVAAVQLDRRDTTQSAAAHRGFVVKSLGDGFMIAFPSASEAIRCARTVRDSASDGWEGNRVSIRAGIHSGDAVREVDDFFGHAVTVAARVAALAQGGEILVTRVVRDLVQGGSFAFDHVRSASLKGIAEPVEVASLA
jgi:hypothetical protein